MTILNSNVTILLYDNYKKNTLKYKFTENPNFWFLTVFLGDLEGAGTMHVPLAVKLHSEAQLSVKKNKKLTLNFPSLLCFQRGQSQCFLQLAF